MSNSGENMSDRIEFRPDGLTAILARLGLSAEVFMHADLCGQWGMDTSGQRKVPFHFVERGIGWLHTSSETESSLLLGSGDFVLFPHDSAHCISSDPERPPQELMNRIPAKDGGRITSLLCGFYKFDHRDAWPLLDSLPDVVVLDLKEGGRHRGAYPLIQLMVSELERRLPGMPVALNQLAFLLFVEVLRMQFSRGPAAGLLYALADRQIGQALNLIHQDFGRAWTVAELAKQVGMSRSVFSQRFGELVGTTPLRYLAEWRLQEAAILLQTSDVSMADVAAQIGYQSEPAFRKAFRKTIGETPGQVRRRSKTGP